MEKGKKGGGIGLFILLGVSLLLVIVCLIYRFNRQAKRECFGLLKDAMKYPETTKIISFSKSDKTYHPYFIYSKFEYENLYEGAYTSKNGFGLDAPGHFVCGTLKNDSKKSVLVVD